jgi:hypothetical protein
MRFLALVFAFAAVTVGSAAPAVAATSHPAVASNCTLYFDTTQARSLCTGGVGSHRPCGVEKNSTHPQGVTKCANSWAPVGSYKFVYPHSGWYFTSAFVQRQ